MGSEMCIRDSFMHSLGTHPHVESSLAPHTQTNIHPPPFFPSHQSLIATAAVYTAYFPVAALDPACTLPAAVSDMVLAVDAVDLPRSFACVFPVVEVEVVVHRRRRD